MIDEIEQIMIDSFSIRVPPNQLRQAAIEIDKFYAIKISHVAQLYIEFMDRFLDFMEQISDE